MSFEPFEDFLLMFFLKKRVLLVIEQDEVVFEQDKNLESSHLFFGSILTMKVQDNLFLFDGIRMLITITINKD